MTKKALFTLFILTFILAACGLEEGQEETVREIPVEVTRIVRETIHEIEIDQVEVTRVVEVTRIVEEEAPTSTPATAPTAATSEQVETPAVGSTPQISPTEPVTAEITVDGQTTWRVRPVQDGSYGPELNHSRPGFGTGENQVGTVAGHTLSFITSEGEVTYDNGCVQAVFPPNTYARNMGGTDWGFVSWEYNPAVTKPLNEMLVLSWELANQQVTWENCPDLDETELMAHILVVEQDGQYVKLTPWNEWRRASGEDHTIMFGPGDMVFGWHMGLGDSQDNLCDNGGCYLPVAPTFGWCGGCIINSTWPGEVPEDATPVALPPRPTPTSSP